MTDPIDPLAALEAWREQGRAVLEGLRAKLQEAEAKAAEAIAERDRLKLAVAELEGRPAPSSPRMAEASMALTLNGAAAEGVFVPEDELAAEHEEPYELLQDPYTGKRYKVYADGREIPV